MERAYTVTDVSNESYEATVHSFVEGNIVTNVETRNKGFMVTLSNGASLHVPTAVELKRLGFDKPAPLVPSEEDDTSTSAKRRKE